MPVSKPVVDFPIPAAVRFVLGTESSTRLVMDPFFDLGPGPGADAPAWRITGLVAGNQEFADAPAALAAWKRAWSGLPDLTLILKDGVRMELGWDYRAMNQHWILVEQMVDAVLLECGSLQGGADAVANWLSDPSQPFSLTMFVHPALDLPELIEGLPLKVCRWATQTSATPASYRPELLRAKMALGGRWTLSPNADLGAAVWCRLQAYALGLPRIPVDLVANGTPGVLRILTGWAFRGGLRAFGEPAGRVNTMDLPAWLGVPFDFATTKIRLTDELARLQLLLGPEAGKFPKLTASGLNYYGCNHTTLTPPASGR